VLYEWIFAQGAGVRIIPVYLEQIEDFPYALKDNQLLDFRNQKKWQQLFYRLKEIKKECWIESWLPKDAPKIVQHALEDLMEASNSTILEVIARILEKERAFAVLPLIEALNNDDSNIRTKAAWALGPIKDARAILPLIEALSDSDSTVRAQLSR
jgi:HEAT repeats